MRFTATVDGRDVTWLDGELSGDEILTRAVRDRVESGQYVSFDYWGERPPSIETAFDAYITIGATIFDVTRHVLTPAAFDTVPDNPDGYEPEGVVETPGIVAAAWRRLRHHDALDPDPVR